MHIKVTSASRSDIKIIIDGINYVLLLLRLPFVGLPCPSYLCVLVDIMSDMINDLLYNNDGLKANDIGVFQEHAGVLKIKS